MRKPINTYICLSNRQKTGKIVRAVRNLIPQFNPVVVQHPQQISGHGSELSINFIDQKFVNPEYTEHLTLLRQQNNAINVMIPLAMDFTSQQANQLRRVFHSVALVDRDYEFSDVSRIMTDLRDQNLLRNPVSVTIIGGGRIGQGILRALNSTQGMVNEVAFYSSLGKTPGFYDTLKTSLGFGRQRVRFGENIEDVLSGNPDVIFLARGDHNFNVASYPDRQSLAEAYIKACAPAVNEALEVVKQSDALKIMLSPEPFLWGAESKGIEPNQITSFCVDQKRANTVVNELVGELRKTKTDVPRESIRGIRWYGSHGAGWLDMSEATYGTHPLTEVFPEFNNIYFVQALQQKSSHFGHSMVQALQELEQNYFTEVPAAAVDLINSISSYSDTDMPLAIKTNFMGLSFWANFAGTSLEYSENKIRTHAYRPRVISGEAIDTLIAEQDFQHRMAKELYGINCLVEPRDLVKLRTHEDLSSGEHIPSNKLDLDCMLV